LQRFLCTHFVHHKSIKRRVDITVGKRKRIGCENSTDLDQKSRRQASKDPKCITGRRSRLEAHMPSAPKILGSKKVQIRCFNHFSELKKSASFDASHLYVRVTIAPSAYETALRYQRVCSVLIEIDVDIDFRVIAAHHRNERVSFLTSSTSSAARRRPSMNRSPLFCAYMIFISHFQDAGSLINWFTTRNLDVTMQLRS